MQPNVITLPVDNANDGNTVDQSYSRYDEYQNRTTYVGENHSPANRDQIAMYRSFPTKSGNFKGTSKSAVKLTEDVSVPGADGVATLTVPCIAEVSFSIPVGMPATKVLELRQRIIALLDDDQIMDDLSVRLMI